MEATLTRGYDPGVGTDQEAGLPSSLPAPPSERPLRSTWLGRIPYRRAWALQKQLAAARASGTIDDQLLLLEHPAVLTLGRGADERHVRATAEELAARGIEALRVERGGEVTYHGPGQLVAYPILGLADRGLLLRPLVRTLEAALIDVCEAFGVVAGRSDGHPGCWCDPDGDNPRKIGALGIRVERGVTYHGIALNVSVDLGDFALIDACGDPDIVSTSIDREVGLARPPSTDSVRVAALAFDRALRTVLASATERPADAPGSVEGGRSPEDRGDRSVGGLEDPTAALAALERLVGT